MYQTDDQIKELFDKARASSDTYLLLCKSQPGNPDHRYQIHSRTPFCVRCSNRDCQHKLQRTALVHRIAELVQGGLVGRAVME